jgi:predicted dienelactone hydrolase
MTMQRALLLAAAVAATSCFAQTSRVGVTTMQWKDSTRNREIPVKIYYPQDATGRCAVILFSHGLGGTREGYRYLGQHWAAHGYVSIHLQHHGSDDAVWRGQTQPLDSMRQAVGVGAGGTNAIDRVLDVRFALDCLPELDRADGPLKGRLDTNRVGVAGHSFGANTALLSVGEGRERASNLGDPRVKAAMALSSPAPVGASYDAIHVPVFHMTGTKDNSPVGPTQAEGRRIPFDHIAGVDQYLVTFDGGDHMVFSGRTILGDRAKDAVFHDLILKGTLAFWDAYLGGDAKAKAWLQDGEFKKAIGSAGVLELKRSPPLSRR